MGSVEADDPSRAEHAGVSIFLSYSREDRAQVLPIIKRLNAAGHDVWWDGLLEGGDRFSQVTETALETRDVVLVAWTARSINSHWVRDEATRGRDRGRMLSVSLDGTPPPLGFRQIQYIDLSQDRRKADGTAFQEVLAALAKIDGKAGTRLTFVDQAPVSQGKLPVFSRRSSLILGGAGVLVAAGSIAVWRGEWFTAAAQAKSVAVMTFENLSNDPEQKYFSAGLSEELRSILSLNQQLLVAAQTSSDKFSDGSKTASEIANALGVGYVLEGSVRRSGATLRTAARLIDGATNLNAWSDVFEREADDILIVQSQIATAVVDALIANFARSSDAGTVRIGGTTDPVALDHYLRGVALYGQASAQEGKDRAALAELELAIGRDANYAAAHAARSRALTAIGNRHAKGEELQSYYRRAMEAARTAIKLAPDLAEGHSALGFVLTNGTLDIAAARQPYEQSFKLGYGNAEILMAYALFASFVGLFEEGREAITRAERLDPLSGAVLRAAAVLEFAAREYDRAGAASRRAIALKEGTSVVHRIIGDIARLDGRYDDARAAYANEPSVLSRLTELAILEAKAGELDAAQAHFAELLETFGDNSLYQQAQVFAQWGQTEDALETLERAFAVGDSGLVLSHTDHNLDPIRQDPRFQALQVRLGFS